MVTTSGVIPTSTPISSATPSTQTATAPAYTTAPTNTTTSSPTINGLPAAAFQPSYQSTPWQTSGTQAYDPNSGQTTNPFGANTLAGTFDPNLAPVVAQTLGQQAASFTNPYTNAEQIQIANMPINMRANQAFAPQIGQSPLAGLTVLGMPAQMGYNTAGLNQAGTAQAGTFGAGGTNIDQSVSNPILQGQIQQINALNAQAHGVGPSVAALQAQQQAQQNIQNQMALIGSQRGSSNAALGLRTAANQAAQANAQGIQAGTIGRAQEALAAQQQLGQVLGTTQGQVMQGAQAQAGLNQNTALANMQGANAQAAANAGLMNQSNLANMQAANQMGQFNAQQGTAAQQFNAAAQNQAALQQGTMNQQIQMANQQAQEQNLLANLQSSQQTNLANLQAAQQTQGLDANEYNAMLQAQMALGNTNMTAAENYAQLVAQQNQQIQALNIANKNTQQAYAINSANNMMGLAGAGIAGGAALGAGALAASDRNLKTNIKQADRSVKNFLASISNPNSTFALLSRPL